jgi:hypothetical protein
MKSWYDYLKIPTNQNTNIKIEISKPRKTPCKKNGWGKMKYCISLHFPLRKERRLMEGRFFIRLNVCINSVDNFLHLPTSCI